MDSRGAISRSEGFSESPLKTSIISFTGPQDCLERRPEARPTAKEAFMRIKSSNLRTQSFDPEDEAPLPAGAPLPPVLKRGVSRLSDLQACE